MTKSALTTGVQTATATGALTPTAGLDISTLSKPTLKVRITGLTTNKKATIQLEDSVNGFTASVPKAVFDVLGGPPTGSDLVLTKSTQDMPSLRAGTTNAVARINVTAIDAATTLTVEAWLET